MAAPKKDEAPKQQAAPKDELVHVDPTIRVAKDDEKPDPSSVVNVQEI